MLESMIECGEYIHYENDLKTNAQFPKNQKTK